MKVKGFVSKLKDCRVKYKDPSEKMKDKQFILVDDKSMNCERKMKLQIEMLIFVLQHVSPTDKIHCVMGNYV